MPRMVHFAGTFRVDAVNQTRYAIPQMPAIAVYISNETATASAHRQRSGTQGPSFVAIGADCVAIGAD